MLIPQWPPTPRIPVTWVLLEVVLMRVSGRQQVEADEDAEAEYIPRGLLTVGAGWRVVQAAQERGKGNLTHPSCPVPGKGTLAGSPPRLHAPSLPFSSSSSSSSLTPLLVLLPSSFLSISGPFLSISLHFSLPLPSSPSPSPVFPSEPPHLPSSSLSLTDSTQTPR